MAAHQADMDSEKGSPRSGRSVDTKYVAMHQKKGEKAY
jgi:hypothetical protein